MAGIILLESYDVPPDLTKPHAAKQRNPLYLTSSVLGTAFVNFFPALERVPGDLFSLKKMMSNADLIKSFIAGYIQPVLRGKEGKENQESCNFIEAYVRQIHKHETSGNVNTTVNGSCIADPLASCSSP